MENTAYRKELERLIGTEGLVTEELCKGGSARRFFRISDSDKQKSLVLSLTNDKAEFRYYVLFADYFEKKGIRVPHFYASFPDDGAVIMEDAGSVSLYDLALKSDSDERIRIYIRVLEMLAVMQEAGFDGCPALEERPFDFASLKWESDYFSEFFLGQHCGIRSVPDSVKEEFLLIAETLSALPMKPMHRDFQSQNIFIKDSEPVFIDFQGARPGNIFYDAASLICDPYVMLGEDERSRLFSEFFSIIERGGFSEGREYAERMFSFASVSRLMQALGAYANLGLNKGKKAFLAHIKPGIESLGMALDGVTELTALDRFIKELKKTLL